MKTIIFLVALVGCTSIETPLNQSTINHEGEEILIGRINISGLKTEPYLEWFNYFYNDYQVDADGLEEVNIDDSNLEILVFLGTWCSDSQLQIPQFIKILEKLNYSEDQLTMVAMDRDENRVMSTPDNSEEGLNITHVPTFIFYQNGIELGRIVEFPRESLEIDMSNILSILQ